MEINGLVSPHVSEVMLGIDFLQQQGAVWNFRLGEVVLGRYAYKLYSKKRHAWCRRVVLEGVTVVPGKSEVNLSTLVQFGDFGGVAGKDSHDWVTEAKELRPGVYVSRTVVLERNEAMPVRVINVSFDPVALKSGAVVTNLETVEVCTAEGESTQSRGWSSAPELASLVDRVDPLVTDDERSKLLSLLGEFVGTFSSGENDLGWTNIVTHAIDTGDSQPIRQPLRRHPPAHVDAIRQRATSMLEQGVIEPSKST